MAVLDRGQSFRPLFSGRDKNGWTSLLANGSEWNVTAEGILEGRGGGDKKPAGLALDRLRFENFRIRFKYRYEQDGAGSLEIRRSSTDRSRSGYSIHHANWPTSDRWQDTADTIMKMNNQPYGPGGGAERKAARAVLAPLNGWNLLEVTAVKNRLLVAVNGELVTDYTDESGWHRDGGIALGVWGQYTAQFKDIMIEELPEALDPAGSVPSATGKSNVIDAVQPGPTWVGEWSCEDPGFAGRKDSCKLLITERSGNRFKARALYAEGNWSLRANVEGTIQGDRIDYEEVGEGSWYFSSMGTILNDVIRIKFQDTGSVGNARYGSGEITLQK